MSGFFATRIEDAEYGTYYDLTMAGYTVLVAAMVVLLLLIVLFTSKRSAGLKARELAYCSLSLALAYIASTFLKLVHMPMGGSITLFSMLFVTVLGSWFGLRTGLLAATAYGLLQLVTGPWIISLPQLVTDYILSFGALGLSGIFHGRKNSILLGYITGVLGRFAFSFLSGMIFFGTAAADYNLSAPIYSLLYNGAYIGGEAALTVAFLFLPPVKKLFNRLGNL